MINPILKQIDDMLKQEPLLKTVVELQDTNYTNLDEDQAKVERMMDRVAGPRQPR
jgi:hypothetical protein